MSDLCERLHEFYDGELSAADAEVFRAHLGDCDACQTELHELAQLGALEVELAGEPRVAPILPLRWARRPRVIATASVVLAAAAALLVAWRWRGSAEPRPPIALALAEHRGIEGRLSHPAAAGYRPYDTPRAEAEVAPEQISLAALAELEKRGDLHGVGAGYLLLGEAARAASYLERASSTAGVRSDQGLALLASGDVEGAVTALAPLSTGDSAHPQALWNRALAYRELGLTLAAARDFERVAELGEAGWSEEARARAAALRAETEERIAAYQSFYRRALAFASGTEELSPDELAAFPGLGRLMFYDAVRAAPTRERALALVDHARALDAVYGGSELGRFVGRAADADYAVRGPLARRYGQILAGDRPEGPAARAYLEALRGAGADAEDILLGALLQLSPGGQVGPADLPELSRLAEGTGDPWFRLLAAEQAAHDLLARHEGDRAEAVLLEIWDLCEREPILYRCARSAQILAQRYIAQHRAGAASRFARLGWQHARRGRDHWLELASLVQLAKVAELRDDISAAGLPLARAYLTELSLRVPDDCSYQRYVHEILTMMLVNSMRRDEALARHERLRRARDECGDEPLGLAGAFVDAHIYAQQGPAAAVQRLRRDLERLRADPAATPSRRALVDHIEGRLLLSRDPDAARQLLRRSIEGAAGSASTEARQARGYSFAMLVMDAGGRGEYDRALSLLAEEAGVAAPERCALGVAVEEGWVAVARGPDGSTVGHHAPARPPIDAEAAQLVPAALREHLAGCPVVDVLARPPVHGRAGLLPPKLAWRYLTRRFAQATPAPRRPERLLVTGVEPPTALGLARLGSYRDAEPATVWLRGGSATPSRVLAAMQTATEIEIHAHGIVDVGTADASFIALSPEPDGDFALTAADVRRQRLQGSPLVILGACHAARGAFNFHEPWSLPAAFIQAGARAVIASPEPIPDVDAEAFFAAVRARVGQGVAPAVALRDVREAWRGRPGADWVTSVLLFE